MIKFFVLLIAFTAIFYSLVQFHKLITKKQLFTVGQLAGSGIVALILVLVIYFTEM